MNNDAFGHLRSLLNRAALDDKDYNELVDLLHTQHTHDPLRYQAQWVPYLNGFPHHFARKIETFTSIGPLREAVGLMPFARYGLDMSNDQRKMEDIRYMVRLKALRAVIHLDLSHNDLRDEGIKILANAANLGNVEALNLTQVNIQGDGLEALARSEHLTNVTMLYLGGNRFGLRSLRALRDTSTLTKLRTLELQGCGITDHTQIKILRDCDVLCGVERLDLSGNLFTAHGEATMADASWFEQVKHLRLRNTQMSIKSLIALMSSPNLAQLETLDLANNAFLLPDPALRACLNNLANLRQLRTLSLRSSYLHNTVAQHIIEGERWENLTHLDLSNNSWGWPEEALLQTPMPALRQLNLAGSELDADDIITLAHSPNHPNLETLIVDDTELHDEDKRTIEEEVSIQVVYDPEH